MVPRSNLGKREMLDELEEFARSNLHLLGSMAVIAIFSHGNWDEGSTEGYQWTGYVLLKRILSISNPEAGEEVKTKVLPSYSECLISHSTLPGYTSSKDKEKVLFVI